MSLSGKNRDKIVREKSEKISETLGLGQRALHPAGTNTGGDTEVGVGEVCGSYVGRPMSVRRPLSVVIDRDRSSPKWRSSNLP